MWKSEHGIEKINPLGEVFNPTLGHEAVQTIESKKANYPSDHVNEVLQCGFRLYDRDLRAASVIVVKDWERKRGGVWFKVVWNYYII